jgi:hypothetical protein
MIFSLLETTRGCQPISTILQAQLFLLSNFGKNLLCTPIRPLAENPLAHA